MFPAEKNAVYGVQFPAEGMLYMSNCSLEKIKNFMAELGKEEFRKYVVL
jgi:hypothetical protein